MTSLDDETAGDTADTGPDTEVTSDDFGTAEDLDSEVSDEMSTELPEASAGASERRQGPADEAGAVELATKPGSSESDTPSGSEDPAVADTTIGYTDEDADDVVRGAGPDLGELEDSADGTPAEQVRLPAAESASMTAGQKIPAALASQSQTVETKPVGFFSGLLAALGVTPSATGSDGPMAPATFITAVLDVIRREMNRWFKNQAPIGAPVQVQHSGQGEVAGSIGASDPEGDPLKYKVTEAAAKGTVTVDADGKFTYTPGAEFAATGGTDEAVVQVRDMGFRLNVLSPRTTEVPVTVTIGTPAALVAARSAAAPLAAASTPAGGVNSGNPGDELWGEAHYAPYVDMAGWPPPDLLAIARDHGVSLLTLAFVQADSDGNAAWGGYPALTPGSSDEQAQTIDASIAAFKAAGGDVMVSFGGENGISLAQAYVAAGRSAHELADAYAGVVDAYELNRIDFDIEGASVAEPASIALRSAAIALLQEARPDLEVWYTLPVLPSGLTHDGLNVVAKALEAGVKLDGINVMAMNFGPSVAPTSGPNAKSMGAYAIDSAESTFAQMSSLFAAHGQQFGWNMLGVTPMIGVNYTAGEVFTVADSQALEDFSRTVGLGMLSMWSVGRDTPGSLGQATPVASGLDVPAGSFSDVWNDYGTVNDMDLGSTPGGGGPVTGGATTVIGWQWGTNTVLNFDPAKDKLDFGWFQPANFEVTEQGGSTRIEIVNNNQTYTLNGVALNEMSMGNIVALDTNTVAKWQGLIGGAGQPTPQLPSISIADLSVSEGNGSHGHFMFVATLSKTSTETVTVKYTTSDGTAIAGSDYVATTGTITFAPGVTSQMVHVDIIGDTVVEANETFTVTLSNPTGATLADATAVGTIVNDDVADPGPDPDPDPDPQPGDGTIYLVSTSGPDITDFDPARDKLNLGDVSVHNFIVIDTPQGVGFMSPWSGESMILTGVSLGQLTVDSFTPILNDHLRQDLSGALAWEHGITPAANMVYVRSHEVGQIDRVAFNPVSDVVDFRYFGTREQLSMVDSPDGVVISNAGTGQALVLLGVTKSQLGVQNFVFHAAQVREDRLNEQLGIGAVPDSQVKPQGVPIAGTNTWPTGPGNGTPPDGDTEGTTTTISWQWGTDTVLGFDPATDKLNFGWFQADNFEVTEQGGSTRIEIVGNNQTYTLDGVAIHELTTTNIVALDDGTRVKWQTLIVNAVPATTAPKISVSDGSVLEGNSGPSSLPFTVTLSKASAEQVSVGYTTSNGTATVGGGDYQSAVGTLIFAPGETSKVVSVTVNGDALVELDEYFTLNLSAPVNATIADGTGTGTIINDDVDQTPTELPSVSIADLAVTEGNGEHSHFMFTATLSKASTETVTVGYATSDGTAIAGSDYEATSGTITFAPGVISQLVHVDIMGDTVVEPDETFTITLSNPTGATIAKATALGTIVNDDVADPGGGDPTGGGINSGNPGDELWGEQYFAPYVDMAGWPPPDLVKIAADRGVSLLTLAFIQATDDGKAAWGGFSALTPGSSEQQAQSIDASIAAFKAAGGDVMVSFGGANGISLAQWHAQRGLSAQELANVYAGVVDAYGLNRVDFDIEGHAVAEPASIALRSAAIALLQQDRPDLEVWYTLSVLPSGLPPDGVNVVAKALEAGVKLDGVNVMAMNYGAANAPQSGPNAKTMGGYAIQAAQSTHAQMSSLFAQHGQEFGWNQIGVTPMIGVNDLVSEVFTVADAQEFEDFARTVGLGMVSMWSVARDNPGSLGQASPTASGTNTPAGSFSTIWNGYGTINEMDLGSAPGGGGPVTGGTTTVIGWQWGTNTVLDFDPAKDKLDFGWFQPGNFEVTEVSGSTRIAIVNNNQTYTLNGVGLNELGIGNIVALDANAAAKWQTLISGAGTM